MKQVLKVGFIGGSINSAVGNTHRIAVEMDCRWILEAGCFSKDKDINRKTADAYRIDSKRVYSKWKEFLECERENLDAVCILTPTNMHTEMVITALQLGYAVICEKALAVSYEEASYICEIVKNNKSFLAVTYNYTGYPMIRELRQMIKEGRLGKINQINIEMPQEGFIKLNKNGQIIKPQDWRLQDIDIPTISLDLGVHLHNMIYFLTGEKPLEVIAEQSKFGNFEDIVDDIMCIAKYTGNVKSQIWYSKSALGHRNGLCVRVYGEKGSAEWFQMNPEELKFSDVKGNYHIIDRACNVYLADESRYNRFKSGHPAGFIEAYANHYYDIADSLIEFKQKGFYNSHFVFNENHAREGLEMLDVINKSSRDRVWQQIQSNI